MEILGMQMQKGLTVVTSLVMSAAVAMVAMIVLMAAFPEKFSENKPAYVELPVKYHKDTRTGLCFAKGYGHSLATVPCEVVKDYIEK